MDARAWNGEPEDDRYAEPEHDPCPDCGAEADEPCENTCGCVYCRQRDLLAALEPEKVEA